MNKGVWNTYLSSGFRWILLNWLQTIWGGGECCRGLISKGLGLETGRGSSRSLLSLCRGNCLLGLWSGVVGEKRGIQLVRLMFHNIQNIEMFGWWILLLLVCFRLYLWTSCRRGLFNRCKGIKRGQNRIVGDWRWGTDIRRVFPGAWHWKCWRWGSGFVSSHSLIVHHKFFHTGLSSSKQFSSFSFKVQSLRSTCIWWVPFRRRWWSLRSLKVCAHVLGWAGSNIVTITWPNPWCFRLGRTSTEWIWCMFCLMWFWIPGWLMQIWCVGWNPSRWCLLWYRLRWQLGPGFSAGCFGGFCWGNGCTWVCPIAGTELDAARGLWDTARPCADQGGWAGLKAGLGRTGGGFFCFDCWSLHEIACFCTQTEKSSSGTDSVKDFWSPLFWSRGISFESALFAPLL